MGELYDIFFFCVCLAQWIFEARHAAKVSVLGAQSSIVSASEAPNVHSEVIFLGPSTVKHEVSETPPS